MTCSAFERARATAPSTSRRIRAIAHALIDDLERLSGDQDNDRRFAVYINASDSPPAATLRWLAWFGEQWVNNLGGAWLFVRPAGSRLVSRDTVELDCGPVNSVVLSAYLVESFGYSDADADAESKRFQPFGGARGALVAHFDIRRDELLARTG